MKNEKVIRAYSVEMRAQVLEDNTKEISGYAAVFGDVADIYGYYEEVIARGAFDGCKFRDVILCINHDTEKIPLARSRNNTPNSTLQLTVDERGLFVRAKLDTERNADAAALYSAVERGDMAGMSFIFSVADEEWKDMDSDKPQRTITKIAEVYEVTAATFPFYEATTLDARGKELLESDLKALESAKKAEEDALASARVERMRKLYKTRANLGI